MGFSSNSWDAGKTIFIKSIACYKVSDNNQIWKTPVHRILSYFNIFINDRLLLDGRRARLAEMFSKQNLGDLWKRKTRGEKNGSWSGFCSDFPSLGFLFGFWRFQSLRFKFPNLLSASVWHSWIYKWLRSGPGQGL